MAPGGEAAIPVDSDADVQEESGTPEFGSPDRGAKTRGVGGERQSRLGEPGSASTEGSRNRATSVRGAGINIQRTNLPQRSASPRMPTQEANIGGVMKTVEVMMREINLLKEELRQRNEGGNSYSGNREGGFRNKLEEKYFRRVDKFEGDVKIFRGWRFDLLMAIGQVDQPLCSEIKSMISPVEADKERIKEGWVAVNKGISDEMFYRYSGELFGVLCSLT